MNGGPEGRAGSLPAGATTRRVCGVCLAGTGMAVPDNIVTNDQVAKLVDTSNEWIAQRTGIKQRHLVDDNTPLRKLGRDALKTALKNAHLAPSNLDQLICATLTPDMICPNTAARIVADVGAVPAGAMDINAACSGFVYGLNFASGLIQSGSYQTIGVIGAETLSRIVDWTDRRTCVLFGDGAGAVVLTLSDDPDQGCLYQTMSSDGNRWADLYCPKTERDLPANDAIFSGTYDTLQMNGREIYKFAVSTLQAAIEQVLDACDLKTSDLKMIIPHQSNLRILESASKRLGLSPGQMYINIDRFANTSAASVGICLHELVTSQRIVRGDLILMVALGGGLTWATSLWRL